jgi:hypothetical protein
MNINPQTYKEHYYFNRSESRKMKSERFHLYSEPNRKSWELFDQIKLEIHPPKVNDLPDVTRPEKEASHRPTDSGKGPNFHAFRLVSHGANALSSGELKFAAAAKTFEVEI